MAAFRNARDIALQATSPRTETVTLPSNFVYNGDVSGNVSGTVNFVGAGTISTGSGHGNSIFGGTGSVGANTTLDGLIASLVAVGADRGNDMFNGVGAIGSGTTIGGLIQTALQNSQITLTSGGTLQNAGGGSITALPYSNTTGGPPTNATANFFTTSGSNPSGGSDGDAHWNSSSSTMWFKTGGVWRIGGTINASQITVGTLAAARIAANSITTDKLNVGVLTDIDSTLGTVLGQAVFSGGSTLFGFNSAGHFNGSGNSTHGAVAFASGASGSGGFRGENSGSGSGVYGRSTAGAGIGVTAQNTGGGTALSVRGRMTIDNSTLVSNLRAQTCVLADDSSELVGLAGVSFLRGHATDVGSTSPVSAHGTGIIVGSGLGTVQTRASGINVIIEDPSDRRLKKNINPIESALDFINSLEPVTFNRKKHSEIEWDKKYLKEQKAHNNASIKDDEDLNVYQGFIADDVEALINDPNNSLVQYSDNGMRTLDKIGLIPYLVKSIQELTGKIEQLEIQINQQPI